MLDKKKIDEYIKPIQATPTHLTQSGRIETEIKCVLFDIYGTLFISGSGDIGITRSEAMNANLEALFLKYDISEKAGSLLQDFYGVIDDEHRGLRRKGIDFPEIQIDRVWMAVLGVKNRDTVRKFAIEFEMAVNPVYPMPSLNEMLSAIKKKNVFMGIISNAQFYTPYLFEWFLGSRPETLGFDSNLIIYSYRHGYAKPSVFLFNLAAQKLHEMQIPANSVLFVGNDMRNDVYPANQSGMKTALFAGDKRSLRLRENDPLCRNLSADIIVTDLAQLPDYL